MTPVSRGVGRIGAAGESARPSTILQPCKGDVEPRIGEANRESPRQHVVWSMQGESPRNR